MDYSYLHEIELVELRSSTPRRIADLVPIFKSCGFTFHDDVVCLDREGKVPPWQHPSVVEVEIQLNGDEVYGFDSGMWELIQLKYLFASLPFELTEQFAKAVFCVSEALGIPPEHNGQKVTKTDLLKSFELSRLELVGETGEDAGSEGLAIFIHSTYPRH